MAHVVRYNWCGRRFEVDQSKNVALTGPAEAETNNYIARLNDLNYNSRHWWYDFVVNVLFPLWILFFLATLGLIIAHGSIYPEWECWYRDDWWNDFRTNLIYVPEDYSSVYECLDHRYRIKRRVRTALWVIGFITLGFGILLLILYMLFKRISDAFWQLVFHETNLFAGRVAPLGYAVHQTYPGCCGSRSFKVLISPGTPTVVTEYNTYATPNEQVVLSSNPNVHASTDKRAFVTGQTTGTNYPHN
jgi:hypothetical protein